MFSIYLSLAFSLMRAPFADAEDPAMYLCETLIDGDVCDSTGMGVYVTYTTTPTRPSTFYPVSPTQWTFSKTNVLNYLGISSSDAPNISGKFSGVFTPTQTGNYNLTIAVDHTITDGVCHFTLGVCPVFLELDFSYSGTGVDNIGMCYTVCDETSCSDAHKKNSYSYADRMFYLVAGKQYPVFAGILDNYTIPQTDNLWMKITYTDPSGKTQTITDESVVGLSGYSATTSSGSTSSGSSSSSSTSSGSTSGNSIVNDGSDGDSSLTATDPVKTKVVIIGVACAVVVVTVIVAVSACIIYRRKNKKDKSSGSDEFGRSKDSRDYDQQRSGREVMHDGSSRYGNDRSSRRSSRSSNSRSSREGSSRSSREGSSRSSRGGSSRSSREGSSRSSREVSSRSGRESGGRRSREW